MGFPYSYSRAATASVEYAKLFYCRRQACHHRDTIKFSEFTFWNYQLFWKHVCFFFSFLIENLLIINTRKWQIIRSDLKLFVNLSIFLFFNSSILRRPATMTRNRCFSPQLFVINHQHCTEVRRAPSIHFRKIFFQKGFL